MKNEDLNKQKSGFKVPSDYFENFEKKLFNDVTQDDTQNNILGSKTNTGFKIPEDYFKTLETSISQKVENNQSKGKLVSLVSRKRVLFISGIAAMIAIIFSISIHQKSKIDFNDILISDIDLFLEDEDIDLSSSEIALLFEDDDSYTDAFEQELIDDETIYDYLSEEDLTDDVIFVKQNNK